MNITSLKYNPVPYSEIEVAKFISEFQEKGYAILPNVFDRDSVNEFKKELEEVMYFNGNTYTIPDESPHYIAAALAPRGRQVLPGALSHSVAKPMPSIHTTIIVIETDETRGEYAPEWHKDRQPDGMPGNEYHYASDVFLAFYFEDIDDDHGPTQIIPGSHRDISMTPFSGAPVESIHLRMEDALLLDQRAWHRGVARKAPGTRFVIVYGAYAMPHHYGANFQMPTSQLKQWMRSTTIKDRVYFGGPFAPPTVESIRIIEEELENNIALKQMSFPKLL